MPSSVNFDTAEYQRSNAAVLSGAITAWQNGGRGQGVTVGVIDSGINPNLSEFSGRIHPATQDVAGTRGVIDTEGHGTAVAGVIAMNRNDSGALGLAFESRILSLNTSSPTNCTPDDGCNHSSGDIARAIDIARENGAKVINLSLGGDGVSNSVLSALKRATTAGIVVVISAGNESAANPSQFALNSAEQAGSGGLIIAGAMDSSRNLASFSNQAGAGAAYYLVALGDRVRTIDETGAASLWSGTSFSAPVISGAAALLASAFPNLTGKQIVDLLLTTADDAGAAGRDASFGNGILNIGRAFQPQGRTTLAGTDTTIQQAGAGVASQAMGDASPAMKGVIIVDGYSRAFIADLAQRIARAPQARVLAQSLRSDVSTTSAGAGTTMVAVTVQRNGTEQLVARLGQVGLTGQEARSARAIAGIAVSRLNPRTMVALGFSESARELQRRLKNQEAAPFLIARDPMSRSGFTPDSRFSAGLRRELGPIGLTVTTERGRVQENRAAFGDSRSEAGFTVSSVTADRTLGAAHVTMGLTQLSERQTVLGGRFDFARGGSQSYFADASVSYDFGAGWTAQAAYRRGRTSMPVRNGLVSGGSLSVDAWSFDLTGRNVLAAGDILAFRIMQPLRVQSGGYMFNAPVSYDYSTLQVGYERRLFGLQPTGREIDLEVAYGRPLLQGAGYLGVNLFARRQPGHDRDASLDSGAAARFSLRF